MIFEALPKEHAVVAILSPDNENLAGRKKGKLPEPPTFTLSTRPGRAARQIINCTYVRPILKIIHSLFLLVKKLWPSFFGPCCKILSDRA